MTVFLRRLRLLVLVCWTMHGICLAVTVSSRNHILLQFAGDPHVPVFQPGNVGHNVLQTTPPKGVANLHYGQDLYGTGNVLYLAHPDYDFHAGDKTAENTNPPGYWPRIKSFVGGAAQYGVMTDLRITRDFINDLNAHGGLQHETFISQFARAVDQGMPRPIVSVDTGSEDVARVEQLVSALRSRLPQLLFGTVVRNLASLEGADARWDFFIVSTEVLPEAYTGQAAMNWLRSRLPPKPVLLMPARPVFYESLVWACTGAAGFQFGDLPVADPDKEVAWRNLRATGAFLRRFPGGQLRLMPELMGKQVFGAVGIEGYGICLMPTPGSRLTSLLPNGSATRPVVQPRWYNPWSDENIITPPLAHPEKPREIRSPSRDYWMYCEFYEPKSSDENSSITLIVPERPDPEDETAGTDELNTVTTAGENTASKH